jgi:D-alanyl-lipoteichoic acid acyltransferase DltB (MBOAT superfamily)
MVFNSFVFFAFFAGVLLLHYLPLPWKVKKVNLLVASYIFYAAWNPPFVILLIIAAVVDFYLAHWLVSIKSIGARRALICISLFLNLGLLGFFKYGQFLLDNFTRILALGGIYFRPAAPDIVLPLGISFYTFETISYLVDVYRGKIKPWHSFLDYALFLTFFPHLVAGPIVRAGDFLPQCEEPKRASAPQMGWGLSLLLFGLFEKMILADGILAPIADQVYNEARSAGFWDAWIGTLGFAGQIFFDFAGYSNCGIGVALCLGFVLKDNFRFPYAAIGFSDFWQRWHISLSGWLRDYLYISLGGNRRGTLRTFLNLILTMLLGGLWHGASWRFVAWGGLHGIFLVCERVARYFVGEWQALQRWFFKMPMVLTTFAMVCVTWVFFRAQSFGDAFHLVRKMFTPSRSHNLVMLSEGLTVTVVIGILLLGHWWLRDSSIERFVERFPWWLRSVAIAGILICLALAPGDERAFIYFQF